MDICLQLGDDSMAKNSSISSLTVASKTSGFTEAFSLMDRYESSPNKAMTSSTPITKMKLKIPKRKCILLKVKLRIFQNKLAY